MVKKSIIAALAILVLLVLLILALLPSLIHKEAIKAEVTKSFRQLTGLDLDIQGDISIISFPVPHVVIHFLDVHNAPEAASPFLMEIKSLEVWPSLASLFHNRLIIDKMVISGVDVELERMKNGEMSWKDSALEKPANSTASFTPDSIFFTTQFSITNAAFHYRDVPANTSQEFTDLQIFVNGMMDKERNFQMSMLYESKPISISGHIGEVAQIFSSGATPANLSIKSGKSSLVYAGDIGVKANYPFIKGNIALETDNIAALIGLFLDNPAKKSTDHSNDRPLPIKASGDIITENGKIILPHMSLVSEVIKGNLQAEVTMPNRIDVKAFISMVDMEPFIASGLFDMNAPEPAEDDSSPTMFGATKSPLGSLEFSADIKLDDILYNNQHIKDAHFNFDTSNGEVNIPLASAVFPGDSRIIFTGIGKQGYQGFALEGEIDAMGNDFAKMLETFKSKGLSLPAEDFKRFRIKANAVISAKGIRLSEIAARIENIGLVGGAIASFGDHPTIEAALRVNGVNLDHFITLWGLQEWRTSFLEDSFAPRKEDFLSECLKRLGYDITLNTYLEQYTLSGQTRDKIEFRMEATKGNLKFKNVKAFYNGSQFSGTLGLNVLEPLPSLDLDITADVIDAATFLSPDGLATPVAAVKQTTGSRWTHDQFDFHWLTLLNAAYHFKIGHFKYGVLQADTIDVKGTISDQVLNVEALTAIILGAPATGKFVMTGGKIPSIKVAADIREINVNRILFLFPVLQDITGKYNVVIRMDTNGTDTFSLISNLEGSVGVGGRDITIRGFNIQGIISAVNYVRTVADILEVVKRALPGGNTVFSTVQGEWVIGNGMLKPSNMTLTNPYSQGIVEGAVDLIGWKIQSSITFFLRSLDPTHPPKVIVTYTGDLDTPERTLDTRSLEQYVTGKTSEKMLDQYGTH